MLELAAKNNEIPVNEKKSIRDSLIEREKSMSTGIGNGVAIPHCATPIINEPVIIMALSRNSIDFDAIDNNPVNIIILLLVPKVKLSQHIKTLANIAKLMSDEKLRQKILALKTTNSIIKAMKKFEHPVPKKAEVKR